jgi:hypothetical protein
MIITLWGDEIKSAKDYANELVEKLKKADEIKFEPNFNSKKGVKLYPEGSSLPNNGIHCIYRKGVPMYVGYSENSTRERLGKFCSAVRDTLRDDEQHIGGERYRRMFHEDFEGLTVKAIEYYSGQDISVKLTDITKEMAINLNCILNDVIYKQHNPDDEDDEQTESWVELWT